MSKHLQERGGGVLPLMSVVVLTIALVACGIAGVEHREALPGLLTAGFPGIMHLAQSVPWPAVFWTALFSTDLLLLIEVTLLSLFLCWVPGQRHDDIPAAGFLLFSAGALPVGHV